MAGPSLQHFSFFQDVELTTASLLVFHFLPVYRYLLSIGAIVALYELVVVIVACITQGQASDSTFAGSLVTFVVDQVGVT